MLQAEGKKGAFHVEIQSVRAVTPTSVKLQQQQQQQQATNTSTAADWNNTCTAEAQSSLRWNVSAAGFDTPVGLLLLLLLLQMLLFSLGMP